MYNEQKPINLIANWRVKSMLNYIRNHILLNQITDIDSVIGIIDNYIGFVEETVDGRMITVVESVNKAKGECKTCARNADNGGYYEPEHRTKCPIQEHYALLEDGYCHLYEPCKETSR